MLEARRVKAVDLLTHGMSITEVARHLGASVSSVKRWKRAVASGGRAALAAKVHPGRPSRLSPQQKQSLVEIMKAGPLAAGFRTDLWTCRRVAEVIRQWFGISYHRDHVGRLLHALGFTQQKPQRRARERDESAIADWRSRQWPRIKKKRAGDRPALFFSTKPASCCNR